MERFERLFQEVERYGGDKVDVDFAPFGSYQEYHSATYPDND